MGIKNTLKPVYHKMPFRKNQYPYANYQKEYKCIFIHIPKTAGTSILNQLNNDKWIPRNHATWKEYQKRSPHYFKYFFKFSFVRNPWDRAVSTYFYIKQSNDAKTYNGDLIRDIFSDKLESFEEFVLKFLDIDMIYTHSLFMPQWFYLTDEKNQLQVDFLGRYENLDVDFEFIKSKIGLDTPKLEKVNISNRKKYHEYYSEKSYAKIADLYSKDIQLFDYKFEK